MGVWLFCPANSADVETRQRDAPYPSRVGVNDIADQGRGRSIQGCSRALPIPVRQLDILMSLGGCSIRGEAAFKSRTQRTNVVEEHCSDLSQ
jgi:hypothetical protein